MARRPESVGTDEFRAAFLGGASDEELVEEGRRMQPEQLLEDAAEVYGQAWAYFSGKGEIAAERVRGCSRELIALSAGQALALLDVVEAQRAKAQALATDRKRARTNLRDHFDRAVKLRDQARSVLRRTAGPTVARDAIKEAVAPGDGARDIVSGLERLAQVGREILAASDPSVTKMYGLDEPYLRELEQAVKDLQAAEAALDKLLSDDGRPNHEMHLLVGINVKLMLQILDAFLGAHELHQDVPLLSPKFNGDLMRRISRLPPPPAPGILDNSEGTGGRDGDSKGPVIKDTQGWRVRAGRITIRKR